MTATAPMVSARDPYIGGEWVRGTGPPLEVCNPANEEIIASVGTCDIDQVEQAILAARGSFDAGVWARASKESRSGAILRMADFLEDHYEVVCATVMQEAGASRALCDAIQVRGAIDQMRELVDLYRGLPDEQHNPRPLHEVAGAARVAVSVTRYEPVGVVAAISAYNFPLWINMWKAIPALLTGSSVVLRPSPLTPLSALIFAEAAIAADLPPGVLNVVLEGAIAGSQLMTTHPAVDMVTFTGSTAVGKLIAAQAAGTVKRTVLELGGKSAQIYLPDAIDRAPNGCLPVFLAHAGQGCILPTRMLVPEESKAEVVERAAAVAGQLKVGEPTDPTAAVGPLISRAQRDKCKIYVDRAVANGATVVAGGKSPDSPDRGFYFEPTVLDVPDNTNPAAQDEIFGPVVCIIGYKDVEDAVRIANDSVYGLSGAVHSNDLPAALSIAGRLRTGAVTINAAAFSTYAPSGGYKQSGIGRERGPQGIRAYQEEKHISLGNH